MVDIVAFGLILGSPFVGFLPGPGGLPVLLAGLGMLASNHHWARRLLAELEKNRQRYSNKFFTNPRVMLATDVIGIAIILPAAFLVFSAENFFLRGLGIGTISTVILVLLTNRNRLDRLKAKVNRKR